MIRLIALAYWHSARLMFKFLSQFQWWHTYLAWLQRAMLLLFKVWAWCMAFVLVAWLLWDFLPVVALGFMAWHLYRWRYRETW